VRFGGLDQSIGSLLLYPFFISLKEFRFCRRGVRGFLENMPERNVCQVNGHHGIRVAARQLFRDCAAPISTVGSKFLIAERVHHQAHPETIHLKERS
jgi:hypothetical protein